jgi:branched-subunit amino acid aminotransferase/4-amino-4-deoxychorismate lyase
MTSYLYKDGVFVETSENLPILVADSLLVSEGNVRSLDKHLVRFMKQTSLKAPELLPELPEFLFKFIELVPRTGNQFPRLEIQSDMSLKVQIRPAPEITQTVTLWTYPEPDPRVDLSVKGPELQLGAEIRDRAIAHGADEAILLTKDGSISEGALSSLVWWEEETLVAPNDEIPWLESVTRQEIFEIAENLGIRTKQLNAKPEDLINKEVWLLSSLQGIRTVTNWIGVSNQFQESQHRELFNRELEKFVSPLP